MPAKSRSSKISQDAPSETVEATVEATESAEAVEETEAPPANPLEAIRRAQASRSLPPGSGYGRSGRGGAAKGASPKAPRMYNRHK